MPLTVENSPALLNEEVDMATQKTQRVRVTRAFYEKNEIRGIGSVLDISLPMAVELRHANKVEFAQSDTKLSKNSTVASAPDASLPETQHKVEDKGKKVAA